MSIQYKFTVIPIQDAEDAESELNRFLRSVRVLSVQKEFVPDGTSSFWSIAVEYLKNSSGNTNNTGGKPTKNRIDYREVLSPEDFAIFARLRDWRKEIAQKEGVPVYTIFTNEQLAEITKTKTDSLTALQKIDGIGEARIKKYGETILELLASILPKTDEKNE